LAGLAAGIGGCGVSTEDAQMQALPPATQGQLEAIFGPRVAPLGLRVTRGGLADPVSRKPSPTGRHLALYVEPTSAWSNAQFLESVAQLGRAVVPFAFGRWGGLSSVDVCQEPSPGVDDRPEPASVTILDANREGAAAVDWERADLTSLLVAVRARKGAIRLQVARNLAQEPQLQAAESRSRELSGPPG